MRQPHGGEPVAEFHGCDVEPISGTNAYQFVDATCPAQVTSMEANYVDAPIFDALGNQIGTGSVPTDNK